MRLLRVESSAWHLERLYSSDREGVPGDPQYVPARGPSCAINQRELSAILLQFNYSIRDGRPAMRRVPTEDHVKSSAQEHRYPGAPKTLAASPVARSVKRLRNLLIAELVVTHFRALNRHIVKRRECYLLLTLLVFEDINQTYSPVSVGLVKRNMTLFQ